MYEITLGSLTPSVQPSRRLSIGHFWVASCLCVKTSLRVKKFIRKCIPLTVSFPCTSNSSSLEKLSCLRTRFETEAQEDSEMAYWLLSAFRFEREQRFCDSAKEWDKCAFLCRCLLPVTLMLKKRESVLKWAEVARRYVVALNLGVEKRVTCTPLYNMIGEGWAVVAVQRSGRNVRINWGGQWYVVLWLLLVSSSSGLSERAGS